MVRVNLAGLNVDYDALRKLYEVNNKQFYLKKKEHINHILKNLTPETISASYARISRDPREIPQLRKDSRKDVVASRKSNKAIIFTMGHKSIAEHAVFNFDILGISRRAIEELQRFRLCSYTEKSQRYITLDGDFVLPAEIKATSLESEFTNLIEEQNCFYKENLNALTDWHNKQDYIDMFKALNCKTDKRKQITIEGLGKEDARYGLGMATQAQVGMTISARNLEVMITRFRSSHVVEIRELGEKLFRLVDGIAPSVIKYTEPVDYFSKTRTELEAHIASLIRKHKLTSKKKSEDVLIHTNLARDDAIIAAMIFSSSNLSYLQSLSLVKKLGKLEKIKILDLADKYQERHDPKIREYEMESRVAEFTLSSSAFAQLKRHRMSTLISQRYLPTLGFTTPESIKECNLHNKLKKIVDKSNKLYNKMLKSGISYEASEYILTNSHKRRVLFCANNRQVHAFCAEREHLAAQWDIRDIAEKYHCKIAAESPLTARNLCGKHAFYEFKNRKN